MGVAIVGLEKKTKPHNKFKFNVKHLRSSNYGLIYAFN